MKIRIPVNLAREEGPGPNENFAGGSDECNFFCFATANQALIKGFEGIVPAHAPKRTHIKDYLPSPNVFANPRFPHPWAQAHEKAVSAKDRQFVP